MEFIKLILNLLFFVKLAHCDCGLPAIPYNAHIDRVQHIYYEGETITYHCQLDDLKLIGNSSRKCVNSRWEGGLPRCVEELYFGTIAAINLADTRNHSLDFDHKWFRKGPNAAAYHADSKREKCLSSSKMSRPHTWLLHLSKAQRHISYIEIQISDNYKVLNRKDVRKIIKYAKINDLRECAPKLMDSTDTTVSLSLTCLMEFEGDSKYEAWEKDQTQVIEIQFDVDVITVCEIRLFTNSFMPFHRCGSADVVLHSTMEFVKSSNKYNGFSYYRYSCDDGFLLEGADDVRCGLNNDWLDPFPTCKPVTTCPFPPSKQESVSVEIKFEHLFSSNGNISAIVGSFVSYGCVGDHTNRSVMIGDSVRVCGPDGKWTGVEPVCIHDYELSADVFNDIIENRKTDSTLTTFESFNKLIQEDNKTSLACGIPAMPLFAKPTSSSKFRLFGGQSDLRLYYQNGSVINYQCESAYRWVAGDVSKRTCIDGKWVGRVGKCAINWGNKIGLHSIYVFDLDQSGKWINQHYVMETNNTNDKLDKHFSYRRDPDKEGECASFTVDAKHRWNLRLNQSTTITYFTVMLHPGGFFGNKRMVTDPKVLEQSAVTAEIGQKQCVLTSAWDYTHSKVGTYFFFTCDMADQKYNTYNIDWSIDLTIDPKKFVGTYTAKNISLCSLAVLASKDDCGTPDLPLHSSAQHIPNTKDWKYTCDEGYTLIGTETITCGSNGRWVGDFPTCQKKELCPTTHPFQQLMTGVQITYKNMMTVDFKEVAVFDSLVNYSCVSDKDYQRVLIGPALRICTRTGQWSGSESYCMDPKDLPRKASQERRSGFTVFGISLTVLLAICLLAGLVWYAFRRGYIGITATRFESNFPSVTNIPKIHLQREASIEPPKDINSNDPFDSSQRVDNTRQEVPKPRTTKINEEIPAFSTGTELLVEPDSDC